MSGETQRQARAAVQAIRSASEGKRKRSPASVTGVQRNGAGQVISISARIDGGELVTGIPAAGRWGLADGARVLLEGVGPHTATDWSLVDIVEAAPGTGSSDPHALLSTPSIAEIATESYIAQDGANRIRAYVTVWGIAEQYNLRQTISYIVQVRGGEVTGELTLELASPPQERVAARLTDPVDADDTPFILEAYDSFPGGTIPSFGFPPARGIVALGAEFVRYLTSSIPFPGFVYLNSLTRGYGSTATSHADGADVTLRGVTLAFPGLGPNRIYEARVQAFCPTDGRRSAWSDWDTFTTAWDVTAPSWSPALTPTAEGIFNGVRVKWTAPNVDAADLAFYEIQGSTDGSTWSSGDILRLGNGTSWDYQGEPGDVRWWRVRAVDLSGNRSAWSNSVRGVVTIPGEASGTNLIANPSFASNLSTWTFAALSGLGTATRVTDIYFDAAGSARLVDTRDAGLERTWEFTSDDISVVEGTELYLRAWLRGANLTSSDLVTLTLRFSSGQVATTPSMPGDLFLSTLRWRPLALQALVPPSTTEVQITLSVTLATGTGTATLWLDNLVLFRLTSGDDIKVAKGSLSSNPGQSSAPLATDDDGLLQLAQLAIGGGAAISAILRGTTTWNPASLADGASATTTVSVAGAVVGDVCLVSFSSLSSIDWEFIGRVTAVNTVTVKVTNRTGGAVDLASGTVQAVVIKF